LFLAAVLAVIPASPSAAQTAQTQTPDEDVVRVTTDLLLFPVRIRDKHKRPVPGLTDRDLAVKDNDRVITALHFSAGAERVALVFALDHSGSLRKIISRQQDAALGLFSHFNQRSRIAIVRFAEAPEILSPFGRDTEAVRAAFKFSAGVNQRTAIFDGAAAAIKTFDQLVPDRSERRLVILISDGLDNASKLRATQVIDAALDRHVSFYVIHLPLYEPRDGRLAVRQPAKGFRDLAEKTGGKYFLAGDPAGALAPSQNIDLNPVFQAIEEDLKSQYLLGFYLAESARDGKRHSFSVTLPPDLEYSVGKLGFARAHDFFVNLARANEHAPNERLDFK